ncbi:MAG TPA: hypothetical protein VF406_08675 [Thermodesulfobacteriota bacterium]
MTRPLGSGTQAARARSYAPTGTGVPTGKPRKFSRYWMTGWLKVTREAPAARASSTLNSTAYV